MFVSDLFDFSDYNTENCLRVFANAACAHKGRAMGAEETAAAVDTVRVLCNPAMAMARKRSLMRNSTPYALPSGAVCSAVPMTIRASTPRPATGALFVLPACCASTCVRHLSRCRSVRERLWNSLQARLISWSEGACSGGQKNLWTMRNKSIKFARSAAGSGASNSTSSLVVPAAANASSCSQRLKSFLNSSS